MCLRIEGFPSRLKTSLLLAQVIIVNEAANCNDNNMATTDYADDLVQALRDAEPTRQPKVSARILRRHLRAHGSDALLCRDTVRAILDVYPVRTWIKDTWFSVCRPNARCVLDAVAGHPSFRDAMKLPEAQRMMCEVLLFLASEGGHEGPWFWVEPWLETHAVNDLLVEWNVTCVKESDSLQAIPRCKIDYLQRAIRQKASPTFIMSLLKRARMLEDAYEGRVFYKTVMLALRYGYMELVEVLCTHIGDKARFDAGLQSVVTANMLLECWLLRRTWRKKSNHSQKTSKIPTLFLQVLHFCRQHGLQDALPGVMYTLIMGCEWKSGKRLSGAYFLRTHVHDIVTAILNDKDLAPMMSLGSILGTFVAHKKGTERPTRPLWYSGLMMLLARPGAQAQVLQAYAGTDKKVWETDLIRFHRGIAFELRGRHVDAEQKTEQEAAIEVLKKALQILRTAPDAETESTGLVKESSNWTLNDAVADAVESCTSSLGDMDMAVPK